MFTGRTWILSREQVYRGIRDCCAFRSRQICRMLICKRKKKKKETANVNTSPWTLRTSNVFTNSPRRSACPFRSGGCGRVRVRPLRSLSLSSPFVGAGFTRTPSLPRRIHPDVSNHLLAIPIRYRVQKCDIAHAAPIGVTHSETHHGGYVTPGLEIRAHYTPM